MSGQCLVILLTDLIDDLPIGRDRPLISPPIIIVVPSTDVPTELRTSDVRIFNALPNSFIISGSQ